ncbi:MAG: hypothetical protein QHH07_03265 [Sedimentisphaerales bacterium]|nr:hypothetical protein [Sedimentisphaerales bacterium]
MDPIYACQQVRDQTDQMTTGQLQTIRDLMPLIAHLEGCAGCREYLKGSLDLACVLDQWEVPEPRRDITPSALSSLFRIHPHQTIGGHLRSLIGFRVRLPAVAAALPTHWAFYRLYR